jgi:addiction module HigA family antidote
MHSRLKSLIIIKIKKMAKLKNIHPGEILSEEFLIPLNISAYKLAKDIEIPQTRVSQILKGNRRITADTALRLSKYFGNSAKFWLGLQDDFDIEEEILAKGPILKSIKALEVNLAQ